MVSPSAFDAQALLLDKVSRQTDELAHLAGDLLHLVRRQCIGERQGTGKRVVRIVERLVVPLILVDAHPGLLEVVGGGGVHGEHAHVVVVLTGERGLVVENGGLFGDACDADAMLAEHAVDDGVAHGAVGFAVQVVRAVHAVVLGEPCDDAAREGIAVTVDTPHLLGVVVRIHMRVASAERIDEHEIRARQQRIRVVFDLTDALQVRHAIGLDALGAHATDVDHVRGATGAAVPAERHRTIRLVFLIGNLGEHEHVADELAVVGAHRNHFRGGGVVDLRAVGAGPRVLLRGRLRQRLERLLLLAVAGFVLDCFCIVCHGILLSLYSAWEECPAHRRIWRMRGPVNVTRPPAH